MSAETVPLLRGPTTTEEFFALPVRSAVRYDDGQKRIVMRQQRAFLMEPDTMFLGFDAEGNGYVLSADEEGFCRRPL